MKANNQVSRLRQLHIKESIPCEKNRILIADDEAVVRDVFLRIVMMNLPKCRIDLATNGAEAREYFRNAHQSVIIMDLMMPVMNGEKAFHEIESLCTRSNWDPPSFIFCTGFSPPSTLKRLIEKDVRNTMLIKPVRTETLIKTINLHLAA